MKMSKKVLSILFAVLMCVSCFALTASAATITSVNITTSFQPQVGGAFPTRSDYTAKGNNSLTLSVQSVQVREVTSSGVVTATAPFAIGKTYEILVPCYSDPDNGNQFSTGSLSVKVNDQTAYSYELRTYYLITVCYRFTVSASDGGIIEFGSYPQSKVSETTALKNAADAATWKSYGYYSSKTKSDYMKYADFFSDNVKYRAVKFSQYRPESTSRFSSASNSYQDDNGYNVDTTYYFKYEPLKWRIKNPDSGYIVCEDLIDAQAFINEVEDNNTSCYGLNSWGVKTYADDYGYSDIRIWLNYDFYNTAFTDAQKARIQKSEVTYRRINIAGNAIGIGTVNDPIFLLPYGSSGKAKSTDYAKCQGCEVTDGFSRWLLCDADFISPANIPTALLGASVLFVSSTGGTNSYSTYNVTDTNYGIRPACYLDDLSVNPYEFISFSVDASASPAAGGTVTGCGVYTGGSHTLVATPNEHYHFTGWYNGSTKLSSNATYSFTLKQNVNYTAKFELNKYTVTATAGTGGTASGSGSYTYNTSATVTATPNEGYQFAGWYIGSDQVSDSRTYTFFVKGDVTLTAKFGERVYTVRSGSVPSEGGSVTGGGTYVHGATVTLRATPNPGYKFVGYYLGNNVLQSTDAVYSFTVTGNTLIPARFEALSSYTVSASAAPAAGGTVTGAGEYHEGDSVTLKATANNGYKFIGWYRGSVLESSSRNYTFTVSGNVSLTAKYEKIPEYTVSVVAEPAAGGTVSGAGAYFEGKTATLKAAANEGFVFCGWYEGGEFVNSLTSYSFSVTGNKTLTAKFISTASFVELKIGTDGLQHGDWYLDTDTFIENYAQALADSGYDPAAAHDLAVSVAELLQDYPFRYDPSSKIIMVQMENSGFVYSSMLTPDDEESYALYGPFIKQYRDPNQPDNPGNNGGNNNQPQHGSCKWCGKDHNGFFQSIIGFFHRIFAAIFGARY